ncbi:MAG: Undecaprenyl-phosphate 4-deoxy-4-formamido-L-arabinose transferase [Microgenomates bacterium OLB23]|nr:MAG: Undecaprenyl-phosphate 4-deoxy-4-formamido-L-arabinose transferase [Microgenomates bacterium OLB23]
MKNKPTYSVVIPVCNEEHNAGTLYDEVKHEMEKLGAPHEIIFVDDGSRDGTVQELLAKSPITLIQLRKNSGQSSALDAGIKHATGEILITMDGDGQDDPQNIGALIAKLHEGYDVVCAWRHKRKDSLSKRFLSWGWRKLRAKFIVDGIHDAGTQFRVYKREVFDDLDLYGEMHRFIPALLLWQGFTITEVKVTHRDRVHGVSKYTWKRPLKGFADLMYMWFLRKYSSRPQQIFGTAGLLSITFGFFILGAMAYLRLFHGYYLSDKIWPLVGFFFLLAGLQLFSTGVIAASLVAASPAKKYFVKKITTQ